MGLTQVSTNGITTAALNAEAGLVKYLRTGDGVYTIFTPDGSTVSTGGTTTEGLQEAINYANANGLDFYCAGGGIETTGTATDIGIITCTTTLQIPACQNRSFVFKSVTLDFTTALGNNPGLKFDSFMMMDFNFAGQVAYKGNGNAVEFDAQNVVPLDNMRGHVDSRIKIDTIAYIQGGTGASPLSSCISFIRTNASNPATTRNHFIFGEVNGSGFDGTNVTLIARNGMAVNHSGFFGNIIDIQGIHHIKEVGLFIGTSSSGTSPSGNTFRVGFIEPFRSTNADASSVIAIGLKSYGVRNDYNFAITDNGGANQNGAFGAFKYAVQLLGNGASGSAINENVFIRQCLTSGVTGFLGVLNSTSTYNNTVYADGAKLDGNFLVGTPIENVFNGAGGNSQMVVAGTDDNTNILNNVNASITISNKDGTANNLAGLHFAREDNDGSPHYVGASVVAQFLETMADGNYPKANLSFLTSSSNNAAPTEKMKIDSSGDVMIGTTDEEPGRGDTNVGISFRPEGKFFMSSAGSFSSINRNNDGTVLAFARSGTDVGSISVNSSNTAYNTSSDYRLKENAILISNGIEKVKTLKPYTFNFKKEPTAIVHGFFAHEVTAVPNAVTGKKDEVDANNNPVYQSMDYGKITPLLTAALQEAIAKIEILETKVAALEAA